MKKSAERKIKAQKQQLVDPIKNAITKKDEEIKPTEIKQFINKLDEQDAEFHKNLTELTETYNHNYRQEQQLHKMVDSAKRFNEDEVRVSRSEVADKLKPVVEKIVDILGENISKRKLIYSIGYLLSYKGEEPAGIYTINNVTAIMKIYEQKFGLPFKESEKESKGAEHDKTKTTYDIKITDVEVLDKVFSAYQSTRESGTFKHLLLQIDSHYNLTEMTVVTL